MSQFLDSLFAASKELPVDKFPQEKPKFSKKVRKSKIVKKLSMECIFFIDHIFPYIKTVRLVYNLKDHELFCLNIFAQPGVLADPIIHAMPSIINFEIKYDPNGKDMSIHMTKYLCKKNCLKITVHENGVNAVILYNFSKMFQNVTK